MYSFASQILKEILMYLLNDSIYKLSVIICDRNDHTRIFKQIFQKRLKTIKMSFKKIRIKIDFLLNEILVEFIRCQRYQTIG